MAVTSSNPASDAGLWAITCHFNPAGYRRRLVNYRAFRERLGVPLVTVELAYSERFELAEGDADVMIRRRGRDVLWQRERLLAVALDAVPAACRKVVWVDADVAFGRPDWHVETARVLDEYDLAQPFDGVHDLPPDTAFDALRGRDLAVQASSFASAVARGVRPQEISRMKPMAPGKRTAYVSGFAWAFRRELFEEHGFYSGGILGGNDRAMACAAVGEFDAAAANWQMNRRQIEHYRGWAERFFGAVNGRIGCVTGALEHLWHGDLVLRKYRARHEGLQAFDFDPFEDIALDDNGCWRWSSDKPGLHRYVKEYFLSRREDG